MNKVEQIRSILSSTKKPLTLKEISKNLGCSITYTQRLIKNNEDLTTMFEELKENITCHDYVCPKTGIEWIWSELGGVVIYPGEETPQYRPMRQELLDKLNMN